MVYREDLSNICLIVKPIKNSTKSIFQMDHNIAHFNVVSCFFPAKEGKRTSNSNLQYKQKSPAIPKCPVNPNPRSSEIIFNSSASHPSQDISLPPLMNHHPRSVSLGGYGRVACVSFHSLRDPIQGKDASIASAPIHDVISSDWLGLNSDGLLKGRNEYWENLGFPSSYRIGKLLDRDHVWVVTQTMVIFEHTLLTYKLCPGFWGRANPYHNKETGLIIQGLGHQPKAVLSGAKDYIARATSVLGVRWDFS